MANTKTIVIKITVHIPYELESLDEEAKCMLEEAQRAVEEFGSGDQTVVGSEWDEVPEEHRPAADYLHHSDP